MLRTNTCGELTEANIGQNVTLCGWVHRRRDHGKLVFIDIRDRWGLTQVVFVPAVSKETHAKALELRSEFVIKVSGEVNKRPKGTENPKIPTGLVEVCAKELTILNISNTPPFEIEEDLVVDEELQMKYRYLDLRRKSKLVNFLLRNAVFKSMRDFMHKENFVDVETPILTKSTPEGARDYLVPSRLNPGNFYALPQSPQLFKQLLMVSGFDRYYQIAKCFRDEDLRADRQPEFTQLDIEMSFIEENDIFDLVERLLKSVFKETKGIDLPIPFPRLTYKECMEKYKSDKPDIRRNEDEFAFLWVVDFPLFKYNGEEKRWESEHHPFTAPNSEDYEMLDKDLSKVRSRSYDLVLNGNEIASGSIRIHDSKVQKKIFDVIKISEDEIQKRFGFLLAAFSYGAPPHGGIALGLDRFISIIQKTLSIRDVIAFPKNQKACCPLTDAPSEVSELQLKELDIKVTKKS